MSKILWPLRPVQSNFHPQMIMTEWWAQSLFQHGPMEVKFGLGYLIFIATTGSRNSWEPSPLPLSLPFLSPVDANRRALVRENGISSTSSVFLCGIITILFRGINLPDPTWNAFHTCRSRFVNWKLCRLCMKLAILLISRDELYSDYAHWRRRSLNWSLFQCLWQKQHHDLHCSIF